MTLDLKGTNVRELPSELFKLQQLRYLLVYKVGTIPIFKIFGFYGQVGIGSLVNLQELFFIDVNQGGVVVKEMGRLSKLRRVGILGLRREDGPELCSSIEKMRNLRWLSVESLEEKVLDVQYLSSPPPLLQTIELTGKLEKFPNWISLLHNLKKILLMGCTSREDPLEVLQALPNLTELKLNGAYFGDELCFRAGGFQTLKILYLSKFERLNLVRVEEGAMPHLEELNIFECKMLEKHNHPPATQARLCSPSLLPQNPSPTSCSLPTTVLIPSISSLVSLYKYQYSPPQKITAQLRTPTPAQVWSTPQVPRASQLTSEPQQPSRLRQ
ncbi:hypothetical protein HHK36_020295 [Tetracentron sinense]|uniref:Disease resistance R13L4/SHOC-2-like LRR domain-containing protein n=1 Tax=Tetracentron sinense TaxID=13715 RepID=A0A834YUX2_TETSI|nr:hypothetical protein HHK36_020295 [Tetracentron sinense]